MSPDYILRFILENLRKALMRTLLLLFIITLSLFSAENKILNQKAPGFRLKTVFGEAKLRKPQLLISEREYFFRLAERLRTTDA